MGIFERKNVSALRFAPSAVNVGSAVYKVALGEVYLQIIRVSRVNITEYT